MGWWWQWLWIRLRMTVDKISSAEQQRLNWLIVVSESMRWVEILCWQWKCWQRWDLLLGLQRSLRLLISIGESKYLRRWVFCQTGDWWWNPNSYLENGKPWKGESGSDRHPLPPELRHVWGRLCKVLLLKSRQCCWLSSYYFLTMLVALLISFLDNVAGFDDYKLTGFLSTARRPMPWDGQALCKRS